MKPASLLYKRCKRQYRAVLQQRFGSQAVMSFFRWGLLTEETATVIGAVARMRREAASQPAADAARPAAGGGAPGPAAKAAAKPAAKAHKARRRARAEENRQKRLAAAQQPGGECMACSSRGWWNRRTKCHWCEALVGECCQANDRAIAMSDGDGAPGLVAHPTKWFLVCWLCVPGLGVTGEVVGRLRDDTPKPPHCSNQDDMRAASPNHPVSSELVQCRHCNRWLCDVCRFSSPPWSCRGEIEAPSLVDPTRKDRQLVISVVAVVPVVAVIAVVPVLAVV